MSFVLAPSYSVAKQQREPSMVGNETLLRGSVNLI